jgi:hypothetical protein
MFATAAVPAMNLKIFLSRVKILPDYARYCSHSIIPLVPTNIHLSFPDGPQSVFSIQLFNDKIRSLIIDCYHSRYYSYHYYHRSLVDYHYSFSQLHLQLYSQKKLNDYFKCTQLMGYCTPYPKRGGLLNMKIKFKQENHTSIHKHDNLGHRPHHKVQRGYSYKHPGHLDGNQTHAH